MAHAPRRRRLRLRRDASPRTCSATSGVERHRAHRARRRRAQGLRGAAAPPRLPRPADAARQPRAVLRPHRARARARARATSSASRCCSSTSTTSRSINDSSATPPATSCSSSVARAAARLPALRRHGRAPRRRRVRRAARGRRRAQRGRCRPPSACSAAFREPFVRRTASRSSSRRASASPSARPATASVEELLRRADLAMYAAKRGGKGRCELYDRELERRRPAGDGRREPERLTWFLRGEEQREEIARAARSATTRSRMVFQPLLDLRTGARRRLRGARALRRAGDAPAERLVRPGAPLRARLRARGARARGRARRARPARRAPTCRSTSARRRCLRRRSRPSLPERPRRGSSSRSPRTSSSPTTRGCDAAIATCARAARGIAVDDAGAGYAGLKHLMRLAPDIIKLDRALVDGRRRRPGRAALIALVRRASPARSARTVCAEGIETLEDSCCSPTSTSPRPGLRDRPARRRRGRRRRPTPRRPAPPRSPRASPRRTPRTPPATCANSAFSSQSWTRLSRCHSTTFSSVDAMETGSPRSSARTTVVVLRRPAGTDELLHALDGRPQRGGGIRRRARRADPKEAAQDPAGPLAGDPMASPGRDRDACRRKGFRSLLRLPIVCGAETVRHPGGIQPLVDAASELLPVPPGTHHRPPACRSARTHRTPR